MFIIINMKLKQNYLLYFILISLVLGFIYKFKFAETQSEYSSNSVMTQIPYTTSRIRNANMYFSDQDNKNRFKQLWDSFFYN